MIAPRIGSSAMAVALVLCACQAPARRAPARAPRPRAALAASPKTAQSARPAAPQQVEAPTADPEAARAFLARAEEPGAKLATGVEPPKVTALALDNTARGEAKGMSPRDAVALATLAEGERASVRVKLEPNECATFIAQGGLGAIEVDLFLTTGSGRDLRIVAEDPTTGPIAVIGGRGRCFRNGRSASEVDLHARMRRGSGAVLVRAYKQ